MPSTTRILARAILVALPLLSYAAVALAAPTSVGIPGSYQHAAGCPGDWDPACPATQLAYDANSDVWKGTFTIDAAGGYEYKAALNGTWDENYGLHAVRGGSNVPLPGVAANEAVRFYYDDKSHWVTSNKNSFIAVVPGSFQSELGCPGDWDPSCLRSWLQDVDGDGIYTFVTTALPAGTYEAKVALDEKWDVNYGAGGVRNGSNLSFTVPASGTEVLFQWDSRDPTGTDIRPLKIFVGGVRGNLSLAQAHWLLPDTIAWDFGKPDAGTTFALHADPAGGLSLGPGGVSGGTTYALTYDPAGLPAEVKAKFPQLASFTALRLAPGDVASVPQILKGQMAIDAVSAAGKGLDATSLQIPGVLDALYTYRGPLGVTFSNGTPTLRVWAPTARSVTLHLYDDPASAETSKPSMTAVGASGVWSVTGDPSWRWKYYQYEVEVYVRSEGKVVKNLVTDPYSLGLSVDSQRSLVTDLRSPETMPRGWEDGRRAKEEFAHQAGGPLSIYELHIRDFSISDTSVPQSDRGKFLAFGDSRSRGMTHLRELAKAGLTYVHLLPSFDIATVPEDPRDQKTPVIPDAPADSDAQQAAIAPVRDSDGFNWGYDPWHYTVPEGSYASDANGVARIREYRAMVKGLHDAGLKVVMDVVYNHTTASGQDAKSVLDRIVPGYYHRLDAVGNVLTNSCCSDTAAEHAMFEKLMIDSTETWTREYQVDGYRFDLMSFHPRSTMLKLRANLQRFDPDVYIYGEGWNFGAVGNDARFVQASQLNLAGTGLGTFSDRLRDGVRGGGPFDGGDSFVRNQGFINGLWYDDNDVSGPQTAAQKDTLLHLRDLIMVGLAGNLKDYPLVDKDGNLKLGSQIDYFGQPAGYTGSPRENIVYASAHDNQTLFDISQYKLPVGTSLADRVRAQTLGLSIIALAQGVSFFHAGDDLLRSKSFDNNSYNSGDWFNRIDFTYGSNNFGVGLPPAWGGNDGNWSVMAPFLRNANLKPGFTEIDQTRRNFLDLLEIRKSSPLFNLPTATDVIQSVRFYNTGSTQNPALIVMAISGGAGRADGAGNGIIAFFNADKLPVAYTPQTGGNADYAGAHVRLHPVQRRGADGVVKASTFDPATGTFGIPARTTAVFVVGDTDD